MSKYKFAASAYKAAQLAKVDFEIYLELVRLANECFRKAELDCNDGGYRAAKPREQLRKICEANGLEIDFPGLFPHITKDGYRIDLVD